MIKNIVFDLGGVAVHYHPKKFLKNRFSNIELEEYLYNLIFGSRAWRRMDLGVLERTAAETAILKQAKLDKRTFEVQSVLDDWWYMLKPKKSTVNLIKRLKMNGYKVYYLSNIPQDVFETISDNYSFMSLFDGGVASYELNMLKPQMEIYKALIDKYMLFPNETVFCDDNLENAMAAEEIGIRGYHFNDAEDFRKHLINLGVNASKQIKFN